MSQDKAKLLNQPSAAAGRCDCGQVGVKRLHGKEWICARCMSIEIAWKKRKAKPEERVYANYANER